MKRKEIFLSLVFSLLIFTVACSNESSVKENTNQVSNDISSQTTDKEDQGKVVATKEFPKELSPIEDYQEAFPAYVTSFNKNVEMKETTYGGSVPIDYLEEHPYLKKFYKGYVFEHQYDRARGHVYALEDVINTKRPKLAASCLACKVTIYNQELVEDPSISSMNFDEYVKSHGGQEGIVGFTCFDCHGDTPGVVQVNRVHLQKAIEKNPEEEYLNGSLLACAQCHVEYYMSSEEKMVTLPWTEGLGADKAYAYYEKTQFADWTHELTGAKTLKAQHPEIETYFESVHHMAGADCMTCHMPKVEVVRRKNFISSLDKSTQISRRNMFTMS